MEGLYSTQRRQWGHLIFTVTDLHNAANEGTFFNFRQGGRLQCCFVETFVSGVYMFALRL